MSRIAAILVAALAADAVIAQPQTAIVTRVDGLATMSYGQTVRTLQPGTPVPEGASVVTGSSGSISIQAVIGGAPCSVGMGPGQAFTMASGKSCAQLVSSVQNLATATAAAGVQPAGQVAATSTGGAAGGAAAGTTTAAATSVSFLGTSVSVATVSTAAMAGSLVGAVGVARAKKSSGD